MNITRRMALAGAFALPGAMMQPQAAARAGEPASRQDDAVSRLDELIADCRLKEAEWLALEEALEDLVEACAGKLPELGVWVDTDARVIDNRGAVTLAGRRHFKTESGVRSHFQICWWEEDNKERIAEKRAACAAALAALSRAEQAYEKAERDLGLVEAERLAEAARDAHGEALNAIFMYRPASLEEMDRKNEFIADRLERGLDLTDGQLAMIFVGA